MDRHTYSDRKDRRRSRSKSRSPDHIHCRRESEQSRTKSSVDRRRVASPSSVRNTRNSCTESRSLSRSPRRSSSADVSSTSLRSQSGLGHRSRSRNKEESASSKKRSRNECRRKRHGKKRKTHHYSTSSSSSSSSNSSSSSSADESEVNLRLLAALRRARERKAKKERKKREKKHELPAHEPIDMLSIIPSISTGDVAKRVHEALEQEERPSGTKSNLEILANEEDEGENLECRTCGEMFWFNAREAKFYKEMHYSAPRTCKQCREAKRATVEEVVTTGKPGMTEFGEFIICQQCSRLFLFSTGEAQFYKAKDLPAPRFCAGCRKARQQRPLSAMSRSRRYASSEVSHRR